jgi:beta-glucosidase/6-phospho-beta-glucosidase/beta-galactosidase
MAAEALALGECGGQVESGLVAPCSRVEVWGGVECTCNRVRDCYFDQMELSGHTLRCEDLGRFAALGIQALRTGLIWERHVLDPSWKFADERLACLDSLGIRCIAGLVHHGSGPSYTSLLDPFFSQGLSRYAGEVAARYPWIDAYTPVNEPHTTARFSGMYGIWYPHHMQRRSYLRALLNQCRATIFSMQAIREVNSRAQLIQTEDVGTIGGTDELRSTWELLSERRWLGVDLLCGRVDRHHPLYWYMRSEGISDREIYWFQDHRCPPDVIGINYYATSDRFLDHRCELYPADRRSAEGPFVDVEAVRVKRGQPPDFGALLTEAWYRYKIPVAITEVHLAGPVEDQIRWAALGWDGVMHARRAGAQCDAITFWALLGSYFWNSLVTCANGHYEPGVFDVGSGKAIATSLAEIVRQIARGDIPQHPALATPGWWAQEDRVLWPKGVDGVCCREDGWD